MMLRIFNNPVWPILGSLLCAAGMWVYAQRVLVAHQILDAAAYDRPRGNLSDLYPRWLGSRELLLSGRNPYSEEVAREIQMGYYGRVLDPARPGDPIDTQGFAYPVYVAFLLAPTLQLPFAEVQKGFFWLLLILSAASVLLWFRVLQWPVGWAAKVSAMQLMLGSAAVMQGLKLQQMSLLVGGLVAIGALLLVTDHGVSAGIVLAFATIKPQLVVLLVIWLAIWTWQDWRRRYRCAVSFLITTVVLFAASEYYLPGWIALFWRAIHDYQRYTGATSVLDKLVGEPWARGLEAAALASVMIVCWRERRRAADSREFAFTLSLVLAASILLVPTHAPYNQVLLLPAVLWLFRERRLLWQGGVASQVTLAITAGLMAWPWISSLTLAVLSFLIPQETVTRGWAIPAWTVMAIPAGVTALMLVDYYQRTFGAAARPAAS